MVVRPVSVLEFEVVAPGLLGRCEWEADQAQLDVEVLAWVGRFRFVTAQAIAARFGVSWQQANARARRLERIGLLGGERAHVSQPQAIYLTGKGHELLGWPRRRAPRAQVQREHEAAIVWLVTELERADANAVVLTERECRQREGAGEPRYSVAVAVGGARSRRWPDVVVEYGMRRRAIEIEFSPKGTDRLRRIVQRYESSGYADVLFLVTSLALGRRLKRLADRSALPSRLKLTTTKVRVAAWPGLPDDERRRVDEGLAPPPTRTAAEPAA
jgi:hypothetical protein